MNHSTIPDLHTRAATAFQRRDWRQAYQLSEQLLVQTPNHGWACYIAGVAALELQQWSKALAHLRHAVQIEPTRADYAVQLARALSIANASGEALRVANWALNLSPCDPSALDTLGVVYTRSQAHERAASVFRRVSLLAPAAPVSRFNYATSLMYAGEIDAAQTELEACLALDPSYWVAHFTLSRLHRQTQASNHLERLLLLSDQTKGNSIAQRFLHMALGKEFEDMEDYSKAFEHFGKAKSASKDSTKEPVKRDAALFEAMTRAFPEQPSPPAGYLTDEPIFVMGMPRSGTTLVERIISSHPYVYPAGELQNFGLALKHASGSRTPSLLDLDTIDRACRDICWEQLGERYLSSTRPMTDGKPRFVDKLPHNFLYLGFIANALPNAKIICLRRNPMDTCLSNFRELFTSESEFHGYSLNLLDTGRYYILFDRLMAHWKRVFPGRILELQYETLVETQEASTRQLLEHCDLPWNERCMRFEQNDAPATSASSVHVRAPIYRTAVRRWKKYESQLLELRELLTEAGIDCEA